MPTTTSSGSDGGGGDVLLIFEPSADETESRGAGGARAKMGNICVLWEAHTLFVDVLESGRHERTPELICVRRYLDIDLRVYEHTQKKNRHNSTISTDAVRSAKGKKRSELPKKKK